MGGTLMQTLRKTELKVTTTGVAGSASGSSTANVGVGRVEELHIDYHGSAPATTDVVFSVPGDPVTKTNILTISNNVTDGYYRPSELFDDATGVDIVGAARGAFIHSGLLTATLAQCDALTNAVTITVWVRE